MSIWRDAVRELSGGLEIEFAEPISHQPMITRPNERPSIDPDKALQTIAVGGACGALSGIFCDKAHEVDLTKGHSGKTAVPSTRISSRAPHINIDVRHFANAPKRGDLIAVLERGTLYEIKDVQADGQVRAWLELTQRGRHEIST